MMVLHGVVVGLHGHGGQNNWRAFMEFLYGVFLRKLKEASHRGVA
jgi:hypothetical protein